MMKPFSISLFILLCFVSLSSQGQVSIQDSTINLSHINLTFKGLSPGGDLADRFGFSPTVGFEVGHKRASNWYAQAGFLLLLAGRIKEDSILRGISTPSGFIINNNGLPTEVRQRQEGFIIPFSVGKIFSIIPKHNPNSGLYVELGGQFIQHKILFQPIEGPIAALSTEYKKGYDRLTNGFGLRQGIGYKYFSNSGYFNMSIGLDLSQHLTQNRRSVNMDTGMADTSQRLDLLAGFTVSWSWLIYQKAPPKYYYN
jgi:hypothetical protein